MSKKNKRYGELGTLWKQSRPQTRKAKCYTINCSARCARNHLLQKNGIINQIEHYGHVRELRTDRFRKPYYSFKRVGSDRAMSMYGYCSSCDQQLFSKIEVPEPLLPKTISDFCRYSLRPIAHEIRKKEGNLRFLSSANGKGKLFLNHRDEYQLTELGSEELLIQGLKVLLHKFTQGLGNKIPVTFTARELPRIEVCASSLLMHPVGLQIKTEDLEDALNNFQKTSFNIVNLFPTDTASVLIIGTHKNSGQESQELQNYVENAELEELTRLVSNMLIAQIEDWAISDELYSRLPANLERLISKTKTKQFTQFYKDTGINLFHL